METSPLLSPFFHHGFMHNIQYKSALELAFNSLASPRLAKIPETPTESNFEIEDLLDFPTEDEATVAAASPVVGYAAAEGHMYTHDSSAENPTHCSDKVSKRAEGVSVPPSAGLSVPPEELIDELEWLSAFNEDSSYTGDTQLASLVSSGELGRSLDSPKSSVKRRFPVYIKSPVSVLERNGHHRPTNSSYILDNLERLKGCRSARSRRRVWSLNILKPISMENRHHKVSHGNSSVSMNGTIDTCSSLNLHHERPVSGEPKKKASRSLSCSGEGFHDVLMENRQKGLILESSSMMNESCLQGDYHHERLVMCKKKPKRTGLCEEPASTRRCSHCLVQKTPQWRAGPLGPKTLCNACGVRYKSGRLLPEYRPASSPTFVSEVHSNSHRRILEMRRARELEVLSASRSAKMQEEEDDECTSLLVASSGNVSSSSSCDNMSMPGSCQMHEEMCVNSHEIGLELFR